MGKIAILHTTPATIGPLDRQIREKCPDVVIENFVDDSILPALQKDMSYLPYCFEKMLCMAQFAQRQGNEILLCACSSVGEFIPWAETKLNMKLVRIDDPVTDYISENYRRITVMATMPTTLRPSCDNIRRKLQGKDAEIQTVLLEGAFEALQNGDQEKHDALITQAIASACSSSDIVFLAQASMARAAACLDPEAQKKVITSVPMCMDRVAELYRSLEA